MNWWKTLSILLVIYAIVAGMIVPLKPGITNVLPVSGTTGHTQTLTFKGYNSAYSKSNHSDIRVWLQYDETSAMLGQDVKVVNDTVLEATFAFPAQLPRSSPSVMLNAIIDHPENGVSMLPDAYELRADTGASATTSWTTNPVGNLHIKQDFTFPYRNVIYESIRNTYYHVPMWFGLMFLFVASVVYSVKYLRKPLPIYDHKAVAYAEVGLLFGLLGLVTGMLWAHYAWGAAWSNDIKQLMTAVALLVYLAYFILRSSFGEPEKGARLAAVYNIFAFSSLIPLLYIVPRMFASLHPGATGNPAFGSQDLDNTMRMVFYPSIIGFSLLGFWIAELRYRMLVLRERQLDQK